MKIFEDYWDS